MKIKAKKLKRWAKLPKRIREGDAGFDFFCLDVNYEDQFIEYKTGIALEIPPEYVGLLFPRSSVTKTGQWLGNSVGVIDSNYRGEIMFRYYCLKPFSYEPGDRIGQIVFMKAPECEIEETKSLGETTRGIGGFGSSGN